MAKENISVHAQNLNMHYLAAVLDALENHQKGSREFSDHISKVFWDRSSQAKENINHDQAKQVANEHHNDLAHELHEFSQKYTAQAGENFNITDALDNAAQIIAKHEQLMHSKLN